jgi:sterol desaturase/sphingolipid hydroxylase (fatty acid hydroxylase superfamily)
MTSASELFIGGVVAWTLVEYFVDRLVLHGFVPTRHGMYHANPSGPALAIFWQIWTCFALVYLIADGAFLAGALVAYAWYLVVHHCAHHGPNNCRYHCSSIMKNHHRFAPRNYGVSTTLWDYVFGTMLH